MREDHRSNETDARRERHGRERRQPGQHVRAKDDGADERWIGAETDVEPERNQGGDDETSGESVEAEQGRELGDDALRSMKSQASLYRGIRRSRDFDRR